MLTNQIKMKFTIKNLTVKDELKLEELQLEITAQDIKENGANIINVIKEIKPLVQSYVDKQEEPKPTESFCQEFKKYMDNKVN